MQPSASPKGSAVDATLNEVLVALQSHAEKDLVIDCNGREVQAGYHVTEVKAASFVTLDCGGNPDAWQETVLQVEDIPAAEGAGFMKVGKFGAILAKVDRSVRLSGEARLTFEVNGPDAAMQVFDVAGLDIESDRAVLRLAARLAICKPRHRASAQANAAQASACCAPSASTPCCA